MIIVGVDGSRTGLEATGWAATEAKLRRAPLTVAYAVPKWLCENEADHYPEISRWMRDSARTVLATAEDRARREWPQVAVESVLLPGDPRTALVEASEQAELLVVGNRGVGGVRGLLVGSVAHGIATHARTDVVLVHHRPTAQHGEVVTGTDGSPHAERAVDFAFREAELRSARLRVVYAFAWPRTTGFEPADRDSEREALDMLNERLSDHRERHPTVDVVTEVVHGHPLEVLREAAAAADLLVVGSRGHGQVAGMLLGSISQGLLHHAPCPLAVVRGADHAP
ncbi:universal stress protein [Nonomuraea maritima]|uniref:universal stress protein n=1 Tax=Nonomuraea maritima TaxID=683260 RepID=UPI00371E8609